jgi:TolB-like protein
MRAGGRSRPVGQKLLYIFEGYALDTDRRELRRGDTAVALQPQVFDLLEYLIRNRDHVVGRDDMLDAVWGGRTVSESTLASRISAARTAIGDTGEDQRLIRTLPRKGVRFIGTVRQDQEGPTRAAQSAGPAPELALPERPSIAVLPFANMTGDPGQEYFVDGMVEEIITALSRIRWLFIIARNSSFTYKGKAVDVKRVARELGVRYVLEGSVRKAGNRLRITGQLIDTATGAHLWADRFDGALDDIFELQDQVAISVAGVIEPTLEAAEGRRSANRPTNDLTAYDLYLRALPLHLSFEKSRVVEALDLLSRAVSRDPLFGPALALSAWCHVQKETLGIADDVGANRRAGIDLAHRALQVAGDDVTVIAPAVFALARFDGDVHAAIALLGKALERNPSSARGWYVSGWLHTFAGETATALAHFEMAARLNPRDQTPFAHYGIGVALALQRDFAAAVARMRVALQQLPSFTAIYRFLAVSYAHMGHEEEARAAVARIRVLGANPEHSFVQVFRLPEHQRLIVSGLRLAMGKKA